MDLDDEKKKLEINKLIQEIIQIQRKNDIFWFTVLTLVLGLGIGIAKLFL